MSLIIVAGPAGAGKTTFARRLSRLPYETDRYLGLPRDERPDALWVDICEDNMQEDAVVEGCEALRAAIKTGMRRFVDIVYWVECAQPKAECGGLTTQQERYLAKLRKERPDVPIYRVTNY